MKLVTLLVLILAAVIGCGVPPAGSTYSECGAIIGFEADVIQLDHGRVVCTWRHRISGKDWCRAYFDRDQWDAYWKSVPIISTRRGEQLIADTVTGRIVVIHRGVDGDDIRRVDSLSEPRAVKVE